MMRKQAVMFLLSSLIVVLVATTAVLGADKPVKRFQDRAAIPARFAPVYSFSGPDASGYTAPDKGSRQVALGGYGIHNNPDTIGATTYEYQHNCTMGRQVEHRNSGYVHFDWMAQDGKVFGVGRGIGYQAYEIAACGHVFASGGIRIEGAYAGYVTIDADQGGWAIPAAHQNEDGYFAKAYWDFVAGGPAYGLFTSDANTTDKFGWWQNNGTGVGTANENIWPKIEWDVDGADDILHMVTTESGGAAGDPQTLSYYRRVGPYGTGLGTWSNQHVIDTVMNINVTVASSPNSDKVAIVWNAPVDYKRDQATEFDNQYENDIWYAVATDNGAAWAGSPTNLGNPSIGNTVDQGNGNPPVAGVGGNITRYAPAADYKAYCDISALITSSGELNIVWGSRRWTDTTSLFRRQSALFHWAENSPTNIRTVVKADWDSGGSCVMQAWGSDAAKPTISACDGKLYVLYTQFGTKANPCGDVDADNQFISGYLYMTVFDPSYDAWDRAQRVTSLPTTPTGCTPGDAGTCNTEYWGSMARYGRMDTCQYDDNVLDIVYVNDKAPGSAVQAESGVWTVNPVIWWQYPCREAVPEPGFGDDAGAGYGICYGGSILVVKPGADTTFTLALENFGILDNNVSSITATSSDPNVTVTITPSVPPTLTIPGRGGSVDLTVKFAAAAGTTDPSTATGNITITHQADGSPRVIPFCVTVSSTYEPLVSADLATTCKQLRVFNNGELSNNALNASLDFMSDADDCASIYLYDGSPIVCRDDAGTKKCFFAAYGNSFGDDNVLRQITPLTVDNTPANYTKASSEFITADTAIQFKSEYFVPKAAADCGYVIEKLSFWNITAATLNDVAIGQILDWDVPSFENASANESGNDATRNLIYQYACGNDPCDSTQVVNRYGGVAAAKNVGTLPTGFKNYFTLQNATYVYTTGPFGNDAPLPSDTIFALMSNKTGYFPAALDSCEDLMTLVTFDVFDMTPNDTFCVVKILSTSKNDATGAALKADIDKANAFIAANPAIKCSEGPGPCLCKPGDANNDGQVNVGDAVYLINFVFKGGPAPKPYVKCSGDANKDCQANVGDAVYVINFVFKGGPAPKPCEDWVTACGPY
jgi:hypothetical protein